LAARAIGLAGLGFLGRGIALCLLEHGFAVVAVESNAAGLENISRFERFKLASSVAEMAHCELVIESISEYLPAKVALFEELEQHVGASVPITSNTSSIPITVLQTGRKHPNRFAGMHWASPAESTRFLEIIRGDHTDSATIDQIFALAKQLDKEPAVVQKDIPGFVANRLAYAMYREAIHLLEEGVADAETIDLLCQHSIGLWTPLCGPFRWMDITGGPALYATAMERIVPTLDNHSEVPETMVQLKKDDARGSQNGRGFYRYQPGDAAEWQAKLEKQAVRLLAHAKDEQ